MTKKSIKKKSINLPPETTWNGQKGRGSITVNSGGKPPKLRFRPGQFVEYDEKLHEILYAYRLKDSPHEWIFCLEERVDMSGKLDDLGTFAAELGCGSQTPRIVYDLFRDRSQVMQYFWDIPGSGDRTNVRTRDLLKHGKVIDDQKAASNHPMASQDSVADYAAEFRNGVPILRTGETQRFLADPKNIVDRAEPDVPKRRHYECRDGFTISIQASRRRRYCDPASNTGPWSQVELGYPSSKERVLGPFAEDPENLEKSVYPYVSVDVVDTVLAMHDTAKRLADGEGCAVVMVDALRAEGEIVSQDSDMALWSLRERYLLAHSLAVLDTFAKDGSR